MSALAIFTVTRISPNGAATESVGVWAHDPAEARGIASEGGWLATLCGPAAWDSPADYGKPRLMEGGA